MVEAYDEMRSALSAINGGRMRVVCILFVSLLLARRAAAQGPELVAGARVRLWASQPPLHKTPATFMSADGDSLVVMLERSTARVSIHDIAVSRLDVSRGPAPRIEGAFRGGLKGGLITLIGSAAVGLVIDMTVAPTKDCNDCPPATLVLPILAVVPGMAVGMLIGAVRPPELWETAPLPSPAIAVRNASRPALPGASATTTTSLSSAHARVVPGSRLRFTLLGDRNVTREVTLDSISGDSLMVRDERGGFVAPLAALSTLELRAGRVSHSRAALKAAIIGVGAGATVGALPIHGSGWGAGTGGFTCGLIGAAYGALFPGERWEAVALPTGEHDPR